MGITWVPLEDTLYEKVKELFGDSLDSIGQFVNMAVEKELVYFTAVEERFNNEHVEKTRCGS